MNGCWNKSHYAALCFLTHLNAIRQVKKNNKAQHHCPSYSVKEFPWKAYVMSSSLQADGNIVTHTLDHLSPYLHSNLADIYSTCLQCVCVCLCLLWAGCVGITLLPWWGMWPLFCGLLWGSMIPPRWACLSNGYLEGVIFCLSPSTLLEHPTPTATTSPRHSPPGFLCVCCHRGMHSSFWCCTRTDR